jgi:hypothetical protein
LHLCCLEEEIMPPRGVKSPKRKRQYKHIKESGKKRGMSEDRAEEMAARTVNKQRRKAGQTKSSKTKTSSRSKKSGSSRSRKGGSKKK